MLHCQLVEEGEGTALLRDGVRVAAIKHIYTTFHCCEDLCCRGERERKGRDKRGEGWRGGKERGGEDVSIYLV